jgi:hypothetical protein
LKKFQFDSKSYINLGNSWEIVRRIFFRFKVLLQTFHIPEGPKAGEKEVSQIREEKKENFPLTNDSIKSADDIYFSLSFC